jgi:hypothetical protein
VHCAQADPLLLRVARGEGTQFTFDATATYISPLPSLCMTHHHLGHSLTHVTAVPSPPSRGGAHPGVAHAPSRPLHGRLP